MACEDKITRGKYLSFKVSHGNGHSFKYNHHGHVMIRRTLLIVKYHLVLIIRREEWIELIGHLNDRGKKKDGLEGKSSSTGGV
jgi:hypothetical protein